MPTSFRIDADCPHCGLAIDADTTFEDRPGRPPRAGELTVCGGCAALAIFDVFKGNLRLRRLTAGELFALAMDEKAWDAAEATREMVKIASPDYDPKRRRS